MLAVTRLVDVLVSFVGLVLLSPVLFVFIVLVWSQDRKSPFYLAPRVAKGGGQFTMVKLRSMVVNADKTGVNSTSAGDARITPLGKVIRKFKLDELTQLWNVLIGDMSLVGPRPQVRADVDRYTDEEREMLSVSPGITDFASIVFSDEGDILAESKDPDLDYNRIIRPWKSRLALVYVRNRSIRLQLKLVWLTAMAILKKPRALAGVGQELQRLDVDPKVIEVARRHEPVPEYPPPGATEVVRSLATTR